MQTHTSLRQFVDSTGDLYNYLVCLQAHCHKRLHWRLVALLGLLAAGFVLPNPYGHVALCLAALAVIGCIWSVVDLVGRDYLMHLITLEDLIRPRQEDTDLGMTDWLQAAEWGVGPTENSDLK